MAVWETKDVEHKRKASPKVSRALSPVAAEPKAIRLFFVAVTPNFAQTVRCHAHGCQEIPLHKQEIVLAGVGE